MVTACVSCSMSVSAVRPGLFLSDIDSALNGSILSSRNITLVINASGLEGVAYPHLDGLQVFHVPVQDRPHAPLRDYFEPVAQRINQNQTGATLVHCVAGRSRSPTLIVAYLMRWTFFLLSCAAVRLMAPSHLIACVSTGPKGSASIKHIGWFWRVGRSFGPTQASGSSSSTMRRSFSAAPRLGWRGRWPESCLTSRLTWAHQQLTVSTCDQIQRLGPQRCHHGRVLQALL